MNSIWKALKRFFIWIIGRPTLITATRIEDLPDTLDAEKVYIVGEGEFLWFAVMICPCGCAETLHMGLMPDQDPRWMVSEHNDGTVSLHPSVWRKIGCKSHFWLIHGKIIWCRTNGVNALNADIEGSYTDESTERSISIGFSL